MAKQSKQLITILIIAAAIAAVFILKSVLYSGSTKAQPTYASKVKGVETAPIKIIEYIDFQCPACALGAKFLKTYMAANPGSIYLEMKHYPLTSIHRHAFLASRYTECARRQNQFWAMHDRLIETQKNWAKLTDAKPQFDSFVADLGIQNANFDTCLEDESIDDLIMEDKLSGKEIGLRSTPTYVVNGEIVVGKKNLVQKLSTLNKPNAQ